jgi:hypothetical protein
MRSRFRASSLFAGGLGALLHKLREGSGLAPLDQIVEKRLTVFGVRLQQNLVDAQRALDAGLIFPQAIISFIGMRSGAKSKDLHLFLLCKKRSAQGGRPGPQPRYRPFPRLLEINPRGEAALPLHDALALGLTPPEQPAQAAA